MQPLDFSLDIVKQYMAFAMLDAIQDDGSDITVSLMSTEGKVESPVDTKVMRVPDGRLILCLQATFPNMRFNNLEVDNASSSQIVNLQIFERLRRYYKLNGRIDGKSHYFLFNSMKVDETSDPDGTAHNNIRCHYGLLGPEEFTKDDSPPTSVIDYEHLYAFEPIFSINGVAHMCFAHSNADIEFYSNADPFPRCAYTVQEELRQIMEWAMVNGEPFSNAETISRKSKELLDRLHFTEAEISHVFETQPDMQIFKYLSGDTSARTRPAAPGPLTEEIDKMIQKRVSHCSFAHFAKLHDINIDASVMEEIKQYQLNAAEVTMKRILVEDYEPVNDSNIDRLKMGLFMKKMIAMAMLLETVNSLTILTNNS